MFVRQLRRAFDMTQKGLWLSLRLWLFTMSPSILLKKMCVSRLFHRFIFFYSFNIYKIILVLFLNFCLLDLFKPLVFKDHYGLSAGIETLLSLLFFILIDSICLNPVLYSIAMVGSSIRFAWITRLCWWVNEWTRLNCHFSIFASFPSLCSGDCLQQFSLYLSLLFVVMSISLPLLSYPLGSKTGYWVCNHQFEIGVDSTDGDVRWKIEFTFWNFVIANGKRWRGDGKTNPATWLSLLLCDLFHSLIFVDNMGLYAPRFAPILCHET